jgi:hypothetical protein
MQQSPVSMSIEVKQQSLAKCIVFRTTVNFDFMGLLNPINVEVVAVKTTPSLSRISAPNFRFYLELEDVYGRPQLFRALLEY